MSTTIINLYGGPGTGKSTSAAQLYAFLKQQGMEVTLKVDTQSFQDATASVLTNNPDLFLPDLVKAARAAAA